MDEKEVALELLRLYLEHSRERIDLEHLVEAYLAILSAISGAASSQLGLSEAPSKPQGAEKEVQSSDDSLFDFKEPLSLSDKNA